MFLEGKKRNVNIIDRSESSIRHVLIENDAKSVEMRETRQMII